MISTAGAVCARGGELVSRPWPTFVLLPLSLSSRPVLQLSAEGRLVFCVAVANNTADSLSTQDAGSAIMHNMQLRIVAQRLGASLTQLHHCATAALHAISMHFILGPEAVDLRLPLAS